MNTLNLLISVVQNHFKPCLSVPKRKICDNYNKVIKKSVLICDNLWTKNSVDEKSVIIQ